VEESLRAHFPTARIARMDSDTMKGRDAYEKVLSAFRARELDLLLGTQMIAKGLDFPEVTVVGVLNADVSLRIPDFRAAERTFQLVAQVAGRAGRASKPGRVVVQTTMPDHAAVILAAQHDFEKFATRELAERKVLRWPPWSRILRVVVLAKGEKTAEALALEAKTAVEAGAPGAKVLGPAPTFLEQLKGKHRFHILVLAPDPRVLAAAVSAVRPLCRHTPGKELFMDVDPMSTA
jgi:primosomal protein N' (replication factor Y)